LGATCENAFLSSKLEFESNYKNLKFYLEKKNNFSALQGRRLPSSPTTEADPVCSAPRPRFSRA
jgi:hypothetical protein